MDLHELCATVAIRVGALLIAAVGLAAFGAIVARFAP